MIPDFLFNRLIKYYDNQTILDITKSYIQKRATTIRINTIKTTKEKIINELAKNNITYEEVEWFENALIITNVDENALINLDILKNGEIYLQSLSSQIPPLFLNPKKDELILDMTAAPGGKTTEIAAISKNQAMITAIEKNKIRFERLKHNIEKQGAKKVTALNVDARNLDEYFMFDKILLDAPCSGSGTLNKDSLNTFNEELINRSIRFQKFLINEAVKHLKVNGELIYSTCSILKEENEEIINYLLKNNSNIELEPLNLENYKNIPKLPVTISGTLCLKPTTYYEGFFVAKLKRLN